jgi:phosphoribosylanthranilate isomerase
MPSGPGVIPEKTIAEIAASVPSGVATFLLTSSRDAGEIIAQQRRCGVGTIQLCDRPVPGVMSEIRDALPGIRLVQVVHVTDESAIQEARHAAAEADAILLDSGDPRTAIKELGGTGRVHDWSISRRIRESVGVPVFLAGGLTPDNVAEAVRQVSPFGVDVCSGLRTGGQLDEEKLVRFVRSLE